MGDSAAHRPIFNGHTIDAALVAAFAFRTSAQPFLDTLEPLDEEPRQPIDLGACIASATTIALAVELYLKALLMIQGTDPKKGGHNLAALFASLNEDLRADCEARFAALPKRAGLTAFVHLDTAPTAGRPPAVSPSGTEPGPVLDKLATFLDRNKDAFVTWRYFHEVPQPDQPGRITYEFLGFVFAVDALAGCAEDRLAAGL